MPSAVNTRDTRDTRTMYSIIHNAYLRDLRACYPAILLDNKPSPMIDTVYLELRGSSVTSKRN